MFKRLARDGAVVAIIVDGKLALSRRSGDTVSRLPVGGRYWPLLHHRHRGPAYPAVPYDGRVSTVW